MAEEPDRPPLLPPPLAAWLGGWALRACWAAGGAGLVVASVLLDEPVTATAQAPSGGTTDATVTAAGPVAVVPARPPAPAPSAGGSPYVTVGRFRPGHVQSHRRTPPAAPHALGPVRGGTGPAAPPKPRLATRQAPPTVPPDAGRYGYTLTRDGRTSTAWLDVAPQGGSAGRLRQQQTWTTDDGTDTSSVDWSPGAETMASSQSGDGPVCDYRPGVVWLRLPLAAGEQWSGESSCLYEGDGGSVRVEQSTAAKVVTAATTSLDGARVFCWVVERDIVTTAFTSGSTSTSETRTTDLFAPDRGLVVYETGKSAAPDTDGTEVDDTWTLQLGR